MKKISILATICLSQAVMLSTATAAEVNQYESNGAVEFYPNSDPELPLDPTNPDPEEPVKPIDPTNPEGPNPGTSGPLSLDYASSFDFGLNEITNKSMTYYARAQTYKDGVKDTPNYVQVTDKRGSNAGWSLKVKQNGQFNATKPTVNKLLTGAEITLEMPKVVSNGTAVAPETVATVNLDPTGAEVQVLSAKEETGAGTWVNSWGTVEEIKEKARDGQEVSVNVTKAVSLFLPGSTPKDAVEYKTTLTWLLTDVPNS